MIGLRSGLSEISSTVLGGPDPHDILCIPSIWPSSTDQTVNLRQIRKESARQPPPSLNAAPNTHCVRHLVSCPVRRYPRCRKGYLKPWNADHSMSLVLQSQRRVVQVWHSHGADASHQKMHHINSAQARPSCRRVRPCIHRPLYRITRYAARKEWNS